MTMAAIKTSKNLAILLILPVAVLLISGCTDFGLGGDSGVGGQGIVITSFGADLTSLESNQDVGLHLEVQNRGDVIGEAAAQLINIDPIVWGLPFTEFDIGELIPADSERGTVGAIGRADWLLLSPDLQRGERRTYKPMVRVFYTYDTRIIKPIEFLTSEETRRAVQNGDPVLSDPAMVSSGPLSVSVRTGDFVRTREDFAQSYFPVEIAITNTGGGLLAGRNYPIGINVEAPTGTVFRGGECPRSSQTELPAFDDLPGGITFPPAIDTINMWNGRDTTVTCELQVVNPPAIRDTRDLKITLSYVYYQDAELQLNVIGTREWGS